MFNKNELNNLYRYAVSLSNNEEIAYDLVHSCIEKIILKKFILNRRAYAKKTIRNIFFDLIKSKSYSTSSLFNDEEHTLDNHKNFYNKLTVKKLLSQLKPKERELLYLSIVEGYSTSEIAKLIGLPKGTITSQLKRLKDMIQQKYGGYNE